MTDTLNGSHFPGPVQDAVAAGLSVVPSDMDKRPKVKWGRWSDSPQTEEDRTQLGHGSLWATVTGETYGFVVLDFDGPEGLETMSRLGLLPHVLTADGAHVYVKHPGHEVKSSAKAFPEYPGLDVKGERSLSYFAGRSKKGTYNAVSWPPEPVDLSAELTSALFPVPAERTHAAPTGTWDGLGAGTPSAVRYMESACNNVRNAEPGSSNSVLNKASYTLAGLVAAGHLDGDAAYSRLLAAAEDRGAGNATEVIRSGMETGREAPWSLDADDNGGLGPEWDLVTSSRRTDDSDALESDEWDEVVGLREVWDLTDDEVEWEAELERRRITASRTISVGQILRRPPPCWLVPGFLQTSSLAELVGPPSAGKSLLALEWAIDVALEGKRVLYAAAEGMAGFSLRFRAAAKHRGITLDDLVDRLDDALLFYNLPIDLGDPGAADDLVSWADESAPWHLVVIDTLARAVPGVEENSAKEMGAAVHAAERLKSDEGTVLLVHHSGHGTSRGRGSSVVLAACDNVIHCFPTSEAYDGRDGKPLRVKVTTQKLKDGRGSKPLYLQTQEIGLGRLNGETLTSVVLVPVGPEEREEERAADIEARVRQKLDDEVPWAQARNAWKGEDRKTAREIWDRLSD